jgi:hypothetical protein
MKEHITNQIHKYSNKVKIITFISLILVLLLPIISAKNIEILIEKKDIQKITEKYEIKTISTNHKPPTTNYEIISISEKEFTQLKKDKSILIQENIKRKILLDESIPLIKANDTWNLQQNSINITGISQTVCILDTGAQTNHPSLSTKNITCNIDCINKSCIENCSITDENGHGTHITGIIVSTHPTYKGTTLNTKYIPIMVCDSNGDCNGNDVLNGIYWCIENKNTYNISVISMSLGGGQFTSYCDASYPLDAAAIDNATTNNISVVVATGNLGGEITNNSAGISNPACIQNSIRIGNTNYSDDMATTGLRHNFFTDIITAPGVSITSTYPTDTYASSSGTSMSTPHVSGIITLLNHYKKLESNTILTPSTIKQFIINSGKKIYDSNTDNNYTRINAYQTILSSDTITPSTESILPIETLTDPQNITFACNASDNLKLENLTLKIYNETSLYYTITNSSPINNQLTINQSINLTGGNYEYFCKSYDNASNYNKTNNKTISTQSIQIEIISPINNTYTNQNQTIINCSTQSTDELKNITLFIYRNSSLIYNLTKNISGLNNYSLFEYNLTNETTYHYNCLSKNNNSKNRQTENYTITYDNTSPQITLTSPENNTRTQTKTHTFTYSQIETNPANCTLNIQNSSGSYYQLPTTNYQLSDGTHTWSITCTDLANNSNTSETYEIEIYTESSSSSGGGGASSFPKTYTLTEEQTKSETGAQQILKTKESVKFTINSKQYTLTLNSILTESITISLTHQLTNSLTLYYNSPTKLNLDNDTTFDIEITLLETNGFANIKIKEINETIPEKKILKIPENITKIENITQTNETQTNQTEKEFQTKIINTLKKIIDFLKKIIHIPFLKPTGHPLQPIYQ